MQNYELLYILPPTLTETEAPVAAGRISTMLQDAGGSITQDVDLGRKKLAYPIKHHQYGYYRLVEFSAEPASVVKLNNTFRLSPELLRYLMLVKPEKTQATIERDEALRARMAARRQQRMSTTATEAATAAAAAGTDETPALSAEELDKKLEKILEDGPNL